MDSRLAQGMLIGAAAFLIFSVCVTVFGIKQYPSSKPPAFSAAAPSVPSGPPAQPQPQPAEATPAPAAAPAEGAPTAPAAPAATE